MADKSPRDPRGSGRKRRKTLEEKRTAKKLERNGRPGHTR
jgi:hypothetical protein